MSVLVQKSSSQIIPLLSHTRFLLTPQPTAPSYLISKADVHLQACIFNVLFLLLCIVFLIAVIVSRIIPLSG